MTEGGSSYLDAINKSNLLNSLSKGEKKQMAAAAKAEKDAERANREAARAAREERLKQQVGSSASLANASVFTEMALEAQAEQDDKGKSKKQLRRGRGAKGGK